MADSNCRQWRVLIVARGFIELANLVEISDITTKANPQEPSDWSRKVEALITRIEYPPFDTDEWYRIWRGESPEGWDRDCYWSYLLGSYCGSGRLQEIGPLSSRRAFFIAAVILRLDSGCGVKVETSLNYTPGGSCVKIPDGTLRDRLISEAHALLEPRNTEANQTLQRTPGTESFPSTESDPRRL
jgi:hypothetical protein